MNLQYFDPDLYETVSGFSPCHCGGSPGSASCRSPGGCTASGWISQRARSPEDYARIKAEKRRVHEESVLAEADAIRARRYQG